MPAQTVIKIRRDTSTNWDSVNPTLAAGEIAFETDTNKIKVGDGSTVWASLDYASGAGTAAEISYDNVDAELIATTVKGALDELSLTKADVSQLSTNLTVFATTAASDITGYNVLVSSIDNPDYNTTAVDVATGAVNADDQLIASLASDAGLFEGQVDPITVTTLGNIRKTAGNANQSASFYFEVYVRNAAGTETLVGTSDDTGEVNPTNLNEYQEFSASAFVSFGTVGATDRIVLKFYGNVSDGAGANYDFQFGGGNPVRTLIPVPATVAVAHVASSVEVDTTTFNGTLSGSDTTVQAALETLDDLDISAGVITSDSPPSAPSNGDLWWESDTGILYIYYDNFWVEAVAGIVGPQGETGAVVADTEPADQSVLWVDTSTSATPESTLTNGTAGYTALSNGTAGLSYQPVSHNYIINGAFDIWQRGNSFSPTDNVYTADSWKYLCNAAGATTASITQQAFTPNELSFSGFGESPFYIRCTLTTGGAGISIFGIGQRIEDVRTLAGQTATFSFYAKSDSDRTHAVRLNQNFGSGGSASVITFSDNFSTSTSWQRFTLTFSIPNTAGKTLGDGSYLQLSFNQEVEDGSVLDIWGVQLEAGSIATPFKRNANSIQGELAACQRYYQRLGVDDGLSFARAGVTTSANGGQAGMTFITATRTAPTISLSGTMRSVGSVTRSPLDSVSFLEIGKESARIDFTETGAYTAGEAVLLNLNSGAYVELDSEL